MISGPFEHRQEVFFFFVQFDEIIGTVCFASHRSSPMHILIGAYWMKGRGRQTTIDAVANKAFFVAFHIGKFDTIPKHILSVIILKSSRSYHKFWEAK